jgi:hypothetical protein
MVRDVVLLIALLAIGGLAFLTLKVMIEEGIDVLVVVSFVILAILGFGVLGALTTPPDDR